jgi:hypothetical protein
VGTIDEEIAVETHDYALSRGRHAAPDRGRCAMEWIADLTGEPHTDRPRSTSEVAAEYVRHFNDVLADGPRQRLRPYLARMIGTAGDGLDELRAWSCALRLARECLPVALDVADLEPRLADDVPAARVAAAEARAAARERARRACAASEWSLRRERARSAARAAGRAAALDAARVALAAAAPNPERSALAETAWAATWDALWAAAWDDRPLPDPIELRAGAFGLLDRMLPGERLEVVGTLPARRLALAY